LPAGTRGVSKGHERRDKRHAAGRRARRVRASARLAERNGVACVLCAVILRELKKTDGRHTEIPERFLEVFDEERKEER